MVEVDSALFSLLSPYMEDAKIQDHQDQEVQEQIFVLIHLFMLNKRMICKYYLKKHVCAVVDDRSLLPLPQSCLIELLAQ